MRSVRLRNGVARRAGRACEYRPAMPKTPTEYRPVPIPNPHRRLWWGAGGMTLAVVAGAIGTGAFASGDDPQALPVATTVRTITDDEALRLALMRFANHRAGGSHFRAEVPSSRGTLFVDGDVDHRRNVGFGQVSGPRSAETVQWNTARRAAWRSDAGTVRTPTQVPLGTPGLRMLNRNTPLHSMLAFVLTLSEEHPEDARKLRRSGARWLGTETVGRVVVDVLESVATGTTGAVRYLVAKDGRLLAVDLRLGRATTPTRIYLDREGYRQFPVSKALRSAR